MEERSIRNSQGGPAWRPTILRFVFPFPEVFSWNLGSDHGPLDMHVWNSVGLLVELRRPWERGRWGFIR